MKNSDASLCKVGGGGGGNKNIGDYDHTHSDFGKHPFGNKKRLGRLNIFRN